MYHHRVELVACLLPLLIRSKAVRVVAGPVVHGLLMLLWRSTIIHIVLRCRRGIRGEQLFVDTSIGTGRPHRIVDAHGHHFGQLQNGEVDAAFDEQRAHALVEAEHTLGLADVTRAVEEASVTRIDRDHSVAIVRVVDDGARALYNQTVDHRLAWIHGHDGAKLAEQLRECVQVRSLHQLLLHLVVNVTVSIFGGHDFLAGDD